MEKGNEGDGPQHSYTVVTAVIMLVTLKFLGSTCNVFCVDVSLPYGNSGLFGAAENKRVKLPQPITAHPLAPPPDLLLPLMIYSPF